MAKRTTLGAVATPVVAGVVVQRHLLDVEAERMMHLLTKVGRRLRHWLKVMPEERAAMRYDRETFTHHPILDATGNHVTEPLIPDKDWLETADWYQKTMLGLLREQRERAKMAPGKGGLPVDDETFELELAQLAQDAVRAMPVEELQKLLAERTPKPEAALVPIVAAKEPERGGTLPFWEDDEP